MRIIKSANELLDTISQMRSGAFVRCAYISSAKIDSTTTNTQWDKIEQDKKNYNKDVYNNLSKLRKTADDLKAQGKKRGPSMELADILGVVKLNRFTTCWQTNKRYLINRANLERAREDFLRDHGVSQDDIDNARKGTNDINQEYGKNGIRMSVRNDSKDSRPSIMLNNAVDANKEINYYLINNQGNISQELTKDQVLHFKKENKYKKDDLSSALKHVDENDELRYWYHEFCEAMKWSYSKYVFDNFIYIVGSVDGQKFIFLNDKLTDTIDRDKPKFKINPSIFINMAKEDIKQCRKDMSWADDVPQDYKFLYGENKKNMKKMLKEAFNYDVEKVNGKYGTFYKVYIDPKTSESTYVYKDKIKEFGAKWDNYKKTWYWTVSTKDNPQNVINSQVKPCIEYLSSVEKPIEGNESKGKDRVISIIDQLLAKLGNVEIIDDGNTVQATKPSTIKSMSKQELGDKLNAFKQELISTLSDAEFKEKLMPIIKFRQAQGHTYSLMNSILIMIQDPKATMVKSKTRWNAMNREVVDGAQTILLFRKSGGTSLTPQEKQRIKQQLFRKWGVNSEDELNIGQKEELDVRLKYRKGATSSAGYFAYDIRFTKQIEGTEELVADKEPELPWFDDSGEETSETKRLFNAILEVAKENGINITYGDESELGGARGYATAQGEIKLLKDVPLNSGMINTITHEFAHQLLHFTYVKERNPEFGEDYQGQKDGRGPVEQQAELTAWIVLKTFGYDMPTNINYIGLWGMDEKNAAKVFDTVAQTATKMINLINYKLEDMPMTESKKYKLNEGFQLNGFQVAKMIGMEDVYLRSEKETEDQISSVTENFNNWLLRING